jgi:hypothetical protein
MNLWDLIRYLFGYRDAIDKIANCPQAFWLGLAFTILAAVARDYDGVYLIGQPYHLLIPLAASLGMATLLYGYIWFASSQHFRISYKLCLTYFWLMAPMAWIYAIPVERWMSALDAARTNLWFLAIVAMWRVLLITRVIAVRQGISFFRTLINVLFVATSVIVVATIAVPKPVFSIMGGVRLSPAENLKLGVAGATIFFGAILWVVLGICLLFMPESPAQQTAVSDEEAKPERDEDDSEQAFSSQTNSQSALRPVANSLWGLTGIMLLVSLCLLAWGQPEQRLRYQVETHLKANELLKGLNLMSQYEPADFPPFWAPPPSVSYNERIPNPIELAFTALESDQKEWVRQATVRPVSQIFELWYSYQTEYEWHRLTEAEFRMAVKVLEASSFLEKDLIKRMEDGLRAIAQSESVSAWQKELAEEYFQRKEEANDQ